MEEDAAVVAGDGDEVGRLVVAAAVGVRTDGGSPGSVLLVQDHLNCDGFSEAGHLASWKAESPFRSTSWKVTFKEMCLREWRCENSDNLCTNFRTL